MLDTHVSDSAVMLRATQTGHILVSSTSGYAPPNYDILKEGLMTFDPSIDPGAAAVRTAARLRA